MIRRRAPSNSASSDESLSYLASVSDLMMGLVIIALAIAAYALPHTAPPPQSKAAAPKEPARPLTPVVPPQAPVQYLAVRLKEEVAVLRAYLKTENPDIIESKNAAIELRLPVGDVALDKDAQRSMENLLSAILDNRRFGDLLQKAQVQFTGAAHVDAVAPDADSAHIQAYEKALQLELNAQKHKHNWRLEVTRGYNEAKITRISLQLPFAFTPDGVNAIGVEFKNGGNQRPPVAEPK